MQKHVTVVGVLHIGYAAWGILWAVIAAMTLGVVVTVVGDRTAETILSAVGCLIPGLLLVLSVPGLIGGIGVLRLKSWARYLVLVVSVLTIFNVPFGTALGIYSIWALVQDETAQLFA